MMKRCLLLTCLAFSVPLASASLHQGDPAMAADSGRIWHVSASRGHANADGTKEDPLGTIRDAILAASDGDTVLVEKGVYLENINFFGRAILLASHFIFDGMESTIESTVIDGRDWKSVITFDHGEDTTSVIRGFTLTGGYGEYGGGIFCGQSSSPTIVENFVIENACHDHRGGSGIYCCNGSHARIYRNLVVRNTGPAAIGVRDTSYPVVVNNTVCDNSWGGISIILDSDAYVKNNIFSNNVAYGIHVGSASCSVLYNDVFGQDENYAGIADQTGANGNISADPFFEDPGSGNYHLTPGSPCRNAGDPADPVPPGGGAVIDMGAFECTYQGPWVMFLSREIDDSGGNDNGVVNPGELVAMPMAVVNKGTDSAYSVVGTLRSEDDFVAVTDSVRGFGDLGPYDTLMSAGSYLIQIDPLCPDSHQVNFELELTDGSSAWYSYFTEVVADTDFVLAGVPDQLMVGTGETKLLRLTLVSLGGFASEVSLTHLGLPEGVTGWFDPTQVVPTDSSIFTLEVTWDAFVGSCAVTITAATAAGMARDRELELIIGRRADPNGDGMIDVADPLYILNYLFKGGDPPSPMEMGDTNCDEVVGLGDAVYLLGYLFKGGPPPICY